MMQIPGFACSRVFSFLTDFVHKASQDFLVKLLIYCLSSRHKLVMYHFVMVKEGDQHHFHLQTLQAGLLWSWRIVQ